MAADRPPVLDLRGAGKRFGQAWALHDAGLRVEAGEVHGLLGENGSGKSTLIKILSGYHSPEPGASLTVNGTPVPLPASAAELRNRGIGFVHQDLGLVPSLSVLENLYATSFATRGGFDRVPWRRLRDEAAALLAEHDLHVDPRTPVAELTRVQRALLAVVRALHDIRERGAGDGSPPLLVLDEVTAFLPQVETVSLLRLIRAIARGGGAVLMVSHDLDEVLEVTDEVTVLRDGVVRERISTRAASKAQLVEAVTGSAAPEHAHGGAAAAEIAPQSRVHVSGLRGGGIEDFSCSVNGGEILGVTGLRGSGHESIPYLLFGAIRAEHGALGLDDAVHPLRAMTPESAVQRGIALVPADRLDGGCIPDLTVEQNLTMQVLGDFRRRARRLDDRGLHQRCVAHLQEFRVRPPDPGLRLDALSGGNQQKVLLAKWLWRDPSLLLLHEPTQGVDVGVRAEIVQTLRARARAGLPILCADEDTEFLAALCDRVLVVARGRVVRDLVAPLSKEQISAARHAGDAVGAAAGALNA
ncbi:MAG TPA: sugar ABC transporter ATP-binding protein [Candidatus Dormibacteraeota bacterium]|jgi:ribose transport system ATP-binding protein|nr:sugar ABC transporter ATP-binding protein [Candidatus Dormibacteraeota bacterium]